MSLTGLLGLDPGLCLGWRYVGPPSNAACCCCWSPPRRLTEPRRCSHHHPASSPCLAPISSLLTHPSAIRISFLPSPCGLSAGLRVASTAVVAAVAAVAAAGAARRATAARAAAAAAVQAPERAQQRQPGRRYFASFRLFAAAAEQQQQQLQRLLRACSGTRGGLGGGAEAHAVGEPQEAPGGVAGARRECSPAMASLCAVRVSVRCACAFLAPLTLLYT